MTDANEISDATRVDTYLPVPFPKTLIVLSVWIMITNLFFVLMVQPLNYWQDYGHASSNTSWVQTTLSVHPLLYGCIVLIYTLVVVVALVKLPKIYALSCWLVACFIHLRGVAFQLVEVASRFVKIQQPSFNMLELLAFVMFTGLLGFLLARSLLTDTSKSAPVRERRFKLTRSVTAVSAVWPLTLTIALLLSKRIPDTGWRPVVATNPPPPRFAAEVAYDTDRGVAVLFGGSRAGENETQYFDDTWEWKDDRWDQRLSAERPSSRHKHAMAFDATRNVVVLFGGKNDEGDFGDTWEWDGEKWQQRYPSQSPEARCCHAMAYDSRRGKVVLA